MDTAFERFLEDFRDDIAWDGPEVRRATEDFNPVASRRIAASLQAMEGLGDVPAPRDDSGMVDALSQWILSASAARKSAAGLAQDVPAGEVHFVAGKYPIFYDFKNTDIVLDELIRAGAPIRGRLLDFGCSSGRNLAVLERAYGGALELHGADPAAPSVAWLNAHLATAQGVVNTQEPPLPYGAETFDLVIAKSIWTHFSPAAARSWFTEMARILAPGGHFFVSTHGPHDIASRIAHDVPRPKYERFAGHDHWTREAFLAATIAGLRQEGYFFRPYKAVHHQGDINAIEGGVTDDWGLMFLLPGALEELLPPDLSIVGRRVARTGNRHDAYVLRKT